MTGTFGSKDFNLSLANGALRLSVLIFASTAMQTQEPQTKVVPQSSTALLKVKLAIKFADELAESPT